MKELEREGLSFSTFAFVHEGDYHVDDADWNYKDVPHLHHIHMLVEAVPAVVRDDIITTINMQKILGITVPVALVNYEISKGRQLYFTALGPFVLVIETSWEEIGEIRTRVTTTYNIGCRWWLKICIPVIKWILRRNYANLMSGDIPMRERRGQLRRWGYSFSKPGERYAFDATMNTSGENVIHPSDVPFPFPVEIKVSDTFPRDGSDYFFGRPDHLGLRLHRTDGRILVFPRLCPHEGADLDGSSCSSKTLRCPWHGRAFKPMAILNVGTSEFATTPNHELAMRGDMLHVALRNSRA